MNVRQPGEWLKGYPLATVMVVVAIGACLPFHGQVPVSVLLLAFVPIILVVARISGVAASTFSAFLTVVLVDLVYTRPYFRLTISDPTEWVALAAFLTVALVVGGQTGKLRERERSAVRRRDELVLLNRLLFSLASEGSLSGTAKLATSRILTILPAARTAIYIRGEACCELLAESGDGAHASELGLVQWVLGHAKAIGLPGSPEADQPRPVSAAPEDQPPEASADDVAVPLHTAQGVDGGLYVRASEVDPEDVQTIVAISNLLGALLERHRVEGQAIRLAAEREAERLKGTLVSSVSHELKTPLAAATAHVSGMLGDVGRRSGPELEEELRLVSEELERLNVSISDLLDLARLETSSWKPRPDTYEVSEILATALSRLSPEQQKRVSFIIPPDVPWVFVDFTQMVQVFLNIMQNALSYSPSDSPVDVAVSSEGQRISVAIRDHGPGIPDSEKERVFEKFYRGSNARGLRGGTGLGLAITREILTSIGGIITIHDSESGGTEVLVNIPAAVIGVDDE